MPKTKTDKDDKPSPEALLARVGLRPTRQRLLLARILFDGLPKHITAEQLRRAVVKRRGRVSLATIYNTLNQFTKAGLLRAISVDQGCTYFDTTLQPHHHFFDEISGRLWDIPDGTFQIRTLPKVPEDRQISHIEITVHLGEKEKAA